MAVTARVAVVTGAASGIGAAVATRLAADGVAVGVLDTDEVACHASASTIVAAGGTAAGIGIDVDDPHSVATAIARTTVTLGVPNILVNTTGPVPDRRFTETSPEAWDKVIGLYLRGAYNLTRTMHQHLLGTGWGRIVMVAPEPVPGWAGHSAYAMARAGLFGLAKALAVELGPIGTTVNAVQPACIMPEPASGAATPDLDELGRSCPRALPLGRTGSTIDVANAVAYLSSDEAAFVTGQILQVSGGHCG